MSQTTRKTTSVSLTIGSSIKESSRESKSSSTLIQPMSLDSKKVCSPMSKISDDAIGTAPVFTKSLQNINAEKGQLVVFECRIRAKPPLQVHWYRENDPIIDSADFKILRKKTCLSSVPEEVCTLIIIEAFPEDSGLFKCAAKNEYGEVTSSAHLFVPLDAEECESNHTIQNTMGNNNLANNNPTINNTDVIMIPSKSQLQEILQLDNLADCHGDQVQKNNLEGGEPNFGNCLDPHKTYTWGDHIKESESKSKDPLQQHDREGKKYSSEFYKPLTSPNPTQYRNNSESMNVTTLPSVSSMYQPSMFNYERPKHFIQSQPKCQAESMSKGGAATLPRMSSKKSSISIQPQSSNDLLPSPTYPISSPGAGATTTITSSKKLESIEQPTSPLPANSLCGQKSSYQFKEQPATFLCSVLPCNNDYDRKVNSTSQPDLPKSTIRKVPKQQISEREIQGTKDALIQDLERKLKCKENVLHNGNQRLTYEERMARRLLGPQNAASVFEDQGAESLPDSKQPENMRSQNYPSLTRSRSSSSGETENRSIQEKFFPPRFLQVPEDLVVEEGRFCRIDFKVSGLPAPDVMWYLNGRPIQADDFHKMIVSEKGVHSFIFEVVQAHDAGLYKCIASNRAGEASFALHLDVLAQECRRPPCFIQKPAATRAVEGDNITMECKVCATPPPDILLKKNNEMLQYNTDRIRLLQDGSGNIYLSIYNVKKSDDGWYTISAVNDAGIATCHARLDIATRANKPMANTNKLKVRPTFSRYSALSGKGLDVQQAFSADTQFQNYQPSYPGLLESDEL